MQVVVQLWVLCEHLVAPSSQRRSERLLPYDYISGTESSADVNGEGVAATRKEGTRKGKREEVGVKKKGGGEEALVHEEKQEYLSIMVSEKMKEADELIKQGDKWYDSE